MPKFKKKEKDLKTLLDKWLFYLQNIASYDALPELFKEPIFKEATAKTEVANYTKEERLAYEKSLKQMCDEYSLLVTAENKGIAKGLAKGEEIGIKKGEEIGIKKGEEIGIKKGEEIGIDKTLQIIEHIKNGKNNHEISKASKIAIPYIEKIRKSIQ